MPNPWHTSRFLSTLGRELFRREKDVYPPGGVEAGKGLTPADALYGPRGTVAEGLGAALEFLADGFRP